MPKIRQQQQDRFARDAVGRHLAKDLTEAFGEGSFSTETGCVDYGVAPRRARMVLDEKGRIVQSLTPLGRATRFLFENDRVRGVQSSAGVVSYFDYDAAGFPQGVQRSDGATEHYAYSLSGDIQSYTLTDGSVMRFERDAQRRLKRMVDRNGAETRWNHDEQGRVTSIVDPRGQETLFGYGEGESSRPARVSHPGGVTEVFDYSATTVGRRIAGAPHSTVTFDDKRRLSRIEYADGDALSLAYGEQGTITRAVFGETTTEFEYDDQGRLLVDRTGAHAVECAYAEGQLSRLTLPDGQSISYEYDLDGRVCAVVDWTGNRQELSYGAGDQPVQRRIPNGLTEQREYDEVDRLRVLELAGQGRTLWRESYDLDVVDRVAARTDSRSGRVDYQYDAAGQLVAVQRDAGAQVERFAYDAAGNRIFGGARFVTYDAGDRAVTDGVLQHEYDVRGNRISSRGATGVTSYEYDLQNQLIAIAHTDGSRTAYEYDAFSRRIRKRRGAALIEYIWAGQQLVQEIVSEGDVRYTREYLYWPGEHRPLAMKSGGKVYYYHCDRLGTPQLLTDAQGNVAWSATYEAFGAATITVRDVEQPLRFVGQYFDDESGLHYNRARYYDPELGSYLSLDPALPPGSANLYRYVSGNPINLSDPLGLFGESWPGWVKTTITVAGSIAVGVAVVALAPEIATVGAAVALAVGVGALAGAAGFGLNAAMTPGGCVLCAMLKGALVGAISALPFAAAIIIGGPIAAMGVATVAGIGAISGAVGYVADCAIENKPWNTREFLKTVVVSAATAGILHSVMGGGSSSDDPPPPADDPPPPADDDLPPDQRPTKPPPPPEPAPTPPDNPPPPKTDGKYADDAADMTDMGRRVDEKYPVKIYSGDELEAHRVVAAPDGRMVYATSGEPVNSGIYVMDQSGNVYVDEKPVFGDVHHSSLAGGKDPVAAGHITADNGQLQQLDNNSGHYGENLKPGAPQKTMNELQSQGVDTSQTTTSRYGDDPPPL